MLIINGIDFDEKLDREKLRLHLLLDRRRVHQRTIDLFYSHRILIRSEDVRHYSKFKSLK